MNVTDILTELCEHGVELQSEGLKLPAPYWPESCPAAVRKAFQKNRRKIMARIAPPVFIGLKTRSFCENAPSGRAYAAHRSTEILSCLALIENSILIWLPRLTAELGEALFQRLGFANRGIDPETV